MRPSTAPVRLAGRELHEVPPLARAILIGTVRRFLDARGFDLAASLAYSVLLTLVPLVACVTVLTSTFFGESGTGLYRLLRILPGAGRDLVRDLQAFGAKATSVSGTATLFFLATSLRTFFLVEGAVQALWGSTGTPRRPIRRLGMALSVMILGPIALGRPDVDSSRERRAARRFPAPRVAHVVLPARLSLPDAARARTCGGRRRRSPPSS